MIFYYCLQIIYLVQQGETKHYNITSTLITFISSLLRIIFVSFIYWEAFIPVRNRLQYISQNTSDNNSKIVQLIYDVTNKNQYKSSKLWLF